MTTRRARPAASISDFLFLKLPVLAPALGLSYSFLIVMVSYCHGGCIMFVILFCCGDGGRDSAYGVVDYYDEEDSDDDGDYDDYDDGDDGMSDGDDGEE